MDGALASPEFYALIPDMVRDGLDELEFPLFLELSEFEASLYGGLDAWRNDHPTDFGVRQLVWTKMWDEIYFELIHVIPRAKDVGSVVSQTVFYVEVWAANYFSHLCTELTIDGGEGVTTSGGVPIPSWWAPFGSVTFMVVVDVVGDPVIDNLITWVFPGYGGADCHVVGLRVVLFALKPNGEVEEQYGYLTEVLQAWDGTEQRVGLRVVPDRTLSYKVTTTSQLDAQNLVARILTTGRFAFSVPVWQDAADLAAPVAILDTEVYVDTVGRDFRAGGVCMLWRSREVWEAFVIASVEADHIHLRSAAVYSWAIAGTLCIPLVAGRSLDDLRVNRISGDVTEVESEFSVEPV